MYRHNKNQPQSINLILSAVPEERIKIPSSFFSNGVAVDPPAVFGVVKAVIVIGQGGFFVVHLAGPLDGLDESSGAGGCSIGGVVVSRRDRSLFVEDFRHVFVEVCSIAVKGIALHQSQGAGGHRFQRVPQQSAKHVTVVEQVYSGYLLYLCSM